MRETQISQGYVFDGIRILVTADERGWDGGIRARLGCLPKCDDTQAELRFEFRSLQASGLHLVSPPPGEKRTIYDCGHGQLVHVVQSDQLYYNHDDRLKMLCDPGAGRAWISAVDVPEESTDLNLLITLAFIEMLKRRGRFSVLAAGVGIGGRSILLAGSSGAGKSTLAAVLTRNGFDFLGDDMCYLRRDGARLQVLGIPSAIELTPETGQRFPELGQLLEQSQPSDTRKRRIQVDRLFPRQIARKSRPCAIVLSRIGDRPESTLTPVSRDKVWLEIAPNVLLTEAESTRAHLDALGDLVRQSDCYMLEAGYDLARLPLLLRPLLD